MIFQNILLSRLHHPSAFAHASLKTAFHLSHKALEKAVFLYLPAESGI